MRLRIGLIGAGRIARERHLPGLRAIPEVEVVVVCNRSLERAQRVADEFGVPRAVSDWQAVLALPEVDAVIIAAPPYLHSQATCAALAAGKHVLCQARMALNVAEAEQMLAASRESDRVTMLVPSPVALPADRLIRGLIAGGYLGQPRLISVRALGSAYADPATPLHWRQMPEVSGVNTLAVGIFNEVIQRWLGDTRSLVARASVSVPQRFDPRAGALRTVEMPDTLSIVAEMANGAQAVYTFSEVTRHAAVNRIEMYGSQGTLLWDEDAQQLFGARADDTALRPLPIPDDVRGEWQVETDFIRGIREGRPVAPTFEAGLKYMRFTEAARRSALSGSSIALAAP